MEYAVTAPGAGGVMPLTPDDRLALADLVARYAALIDDRRLDEIPALFTDDGVLVLPDPPEQLGPSIEHVGRARVHEAIAPLAAVPLTFHALVGQVFDADDAGPDLAHGRVACVAHHVTDWTDEVWHLTCRDTYGRTGGRWLIARREVAIETIETRAVRRSRT